ncbi:hypothetical protein [Leeuwenhoekiella sp. MAR_2009_132]|uniref:hypothetical protein n=1 Tax=Leeuwenhoekiella sp. MAR_2009_132 TaxID=1392489 RepID=UPI000F6799AC|nr:hypothetical protein [Leeuwenhoekiella sp. MAR_2009_132]
MIKKSNILKSGISLMLVLAFFSFKILDLHKYSHTNDSAKGSHCELCLLTQHSKKSLDLDLPVVFEFNAHEPILVDKVSVFYTEFIKVTRFPFGRSLNKAPPVLSV